MFAYIPNDILYYYNYFITKEHNLASNCLVIVGKQITHRDTPNWLPGIVEPSHPENVSGYAQMDQNYKTHPKTYSIILFNKLVNTLYSYDK